MNQMNPPALLARTLSAIIPLATVAAGLLTLGLASPAWGYIDYNPTLGDVVNASLIIQVVQVEKVSKEKRVIVFQKVKDIKGKGDDQVKLAIAKEFHGLPRDADALIDWAEPGKSALFFHNKSQSYICLGKRWYESFAMKEPGWWQTHAFKSTGSFAYMGSAANLAKHVADMLSGKQVVVTALRWVDGVPYAQTNADYRNLVRSRGATPIWRMKASTQLYGYQQVIGNKANIVGLGGGGHNDVAEFLKSLKSAKAQVRAEAAEDLGWIGADAKSAIPSLVEALQDTDRATRLSAAVAMSRIDAAQGGTAVRALLPELKASELAARIAVIEALGDMGPAGKEAAAVLIALLKDKDTTLAWRSAESLGWIGDTSAALPLAELYKSDRLRFGEAEPLATALKQLGPRGKAAVPIMIDLVKARDRTAAEILAAIGADASPAVPALIAALKDKELYFSIQAAMGLAYIGTPEAVDAVVPFLLGIIKSPPSNYHQYALGYLGALGPKAKAAVPVLAPLRKDPQIGYLVEESLRKIQPK